MKEIICYRVFLYDKKGDRCGEGSTKNKDEFVRKADLSLDEKFVDWNTKVIIIPLERGKDTNKTNRKREKVEPYYGIKGIIEKALEK